jgi:predicted nucleic acid-binding protein
MRLYLDTSVFSALFDTRTPERQAMTKAFWKTLGGHELICSRLTVDEMSRAPDEAAQAMLSLARDVRVVEVGEGVKSLAADYVSQGVVPARHLADAIHIAAAVIGEADVLVSWNFEHMVKRTTRLLVNYVNSTRGMRTIEILAPPEI